MTATLPEKLDTLCLTWMAQNIEELIEDATQRRLGPRQLVETLVDGEREARLARAAQRRLKRAKIPAEKTLDGFDFNWADGLDEDAVRELMRLDFLHRGQNIVFIGNVGLGKSHIAYAIAREACLRNHSVRCVSAWKLAPELIAARKAGTFGRLFKKLVNPDLLLVDELGFVGMDQLQADIFFQLICTRYEANRSLIITPNRPYGEWDKTFANDNVIASAITDRLVHRSRTFILTGESRRLHEHQSA